MDQELIAYLDRRFDAIDERFNAIDGRFGTMEGRFGTMEGRFGTMEGRFESLKGRFETMEGRFETMEGRIATVESRFGELREEMNRRFEEAAETARHTLVLLEELRDEVHLVAEAHLGLRDQVKTNESEIDRKLSQTEAAVGPYYRDLNNRVQALEDWRDRQQDEVSDVLRKVVENQRRQREAG